MINVEYEVMEKRTKQIKVPYLDAQQLDDICDMLKCDEKCSDCIFLQRNYSIICEDEYLTTEEKFCNFLLDNDIYYLYYKNLHRAEQDITDHRPHGFSDVSYWIDGAFNWSKTEQGHDFWNRFSEEWQELLNE